ncbi:MAG: energy transducer TonB, partial [Verrucomicrobiota bacterium]
DLNLDGIFDIADLDQKPKPTKRVRPQYPKEFARKKQQGKVRLLFVVDQDGNVLDVEVIDATHGKFADSAVKAISQWKFEPGLKHGHAVKTRVRLTIPFNIK